MLQVEKGRLHLYKRETPSSENGKKKKRITKRKIYIYRKYLKRALYLRKMRHECFNFLSTEYKEGEEIEDQDNDKETLENMLAKDK